MNHQQFEHWLLMEEPLPDEQAERLRSHLQSCQSCQQLSATWLEVQQLFQSTPFVEPESGFVTRWQERLETQIAEEMRIRHRRLSWLVFILTSLSTVFLLALIVYQMTSTFRSTSQFLVYGINQLISLLSAANVIVEVGDVMFTTIFSVVPLSYWIVLLSSLSVLCLFWILSLQKIYIRGGLFNEIEN